jgi:hypothetical protein
MNSSGIRAARTIRPRPAYLRVVPDPTVLEPTACDVPWCTSTHTGEDPAELIHLGDLEQVGPVELLDQACNGHVTTILQLDGYAQGALDLAGIDQLITALQEHRALLATGVAA